MCEYSCFLYFREDVLIAIDSTRPVFVWNPGSKFSLLLKEFNRTNEKETATQSDEEDPAATEWPYQGPIVEGWPPNVSRNISVYLRPGQNTTLLFPRLAGFFAAGSSIKRQ